MLFNLPLVGVKHDTALQVAFVKDASTMIVVVVNHLHGYGVFEEVGTAMLSVGPEAEFVTASGKGEFLNVAGDGMVACRDGHETLCGKRLEIHQEIVLAGEQVDRQATFVAAFRHRYVAAYAQKSAAVGRDGLVVAVEELDGGVSNRTVVALGAWVLP